MHYFSQPINKLLDEQTHPATGGIQQPTEPTHSESCPRIKGLKAKSKVLVLRAVLNIKRQRKADVPWLSVVVGLSAFTAKVMG